MTSTITHPGELTLRRIVGGETVEASVTEHVAACDACGTRLEALREEQRRFEAELPFERFAAGVERAARRPREVRRPVVLANVRFALALAACLAVTIAVQTVGGRDEAALNRTKGGAGVDVVVAGTGVQRVASSDPATPEALAPGERVRVGLASGPWHYGMVLSVDEQGVVSPVYVDGKRSLALRAQREPQYLPDSLEFTGKGLERMIVVLSDEPLQVDDVAWLVRERFAAARGDLTKLETLNLRGEQFHRTFLKP